MAVRGRAGRVVAAGAGSGAGVRAYGVYLQDDGIGDGAAGSRLSVDASWLDATGVDGGVACTGRSLVSARFVAPAGGVFGASGVVDAGDALAPHVVVEPDVATPPAGETKGSMCLAVGRTSLPPILALLPQSPPQGPRQIPR